MSANTYYPFKENNILQEKIEKFAMKNSIEYSKVADPTTTININNDKLIINIDIKEIQEEELELSLSQESLLLKSTNTGEILKTLTLPTKINDKESQVKFKEEIIEIIVPKGN